jgi:hypothetical protein
VNPVGLGIAPEPESPKGVAEPDLLPQCGLLLRSAQEYEIKDGRNHRAAHRPHEPAPLARDPTWAPNPLIVIQERTNSQLQQVRNANVLRSFAGYKF